MTRQQKASVLRFGLGAVAGITLTPIFGIMVLALDVDMIPMF